MKMADENTTADGAGEPAANGQGPAVALQTVYIKDLSFEAPKGPFLPAQSQDPKISLNLSTMSNTVGQDAHEVVLSVTLEAKNGDVAVYVAEVKQAGVFVVRGFGVDETRRILGSFAPNILFPYIRQTVSDVVTKGGFPPFLLPHVNFDALFERSLQEQAARQTQPAPAPEQTN
jgi:preprotein translocase subunit SecB